MLRFTSLAHLSRALPARLFISFNSVLTVASYHTRRFVSNEYIFFYWQWYLRITLFYLIGFQMKIFVFF